MSVLSFRRDCVSSHLYTEISSVHVVSQEQVSRLCRVTANLEQLHKIKVLSVNVTAHSDRRVHFQQIRLFAQNFCSLLDNPQGLILGQPAFAVEVLFQKLNVWLGAVMRREKLLIGRHLKSWRLYICRNISVCSYLSLRVARLVSCARIDLVQGR